MTDRTVRSISLRHCETEYVQAVNASITEIKLMTVADLDMDGRSAWQWFRLPNGDLIFGCFPQGNTYEEVTQSHLKGAL